MKRPKINYFEQTVSHHLAPLSLYQQLTDNDAIGRKETLLFESADIEHQRALKSLLVIESSLRIIAKKEIITIQALTQSGERLIRYIAEAFPEKLQYQTSTEITLFYAQDLFDKESYLSVLREIQSVFKEMNTPYCGFLGGIFGYDLVGIFKGITIPTINHDFDLILYLAETMIVVDHSLQRTTLHKVTVDNPVNVDLLLNLIEGLDGQSPQILSSIIEDTNAKVVEEPAEDFLQAVMEFKEAIERGELQQIVPSRSFKVSCVSAINAYERLKAVYPSPYLFYMEDRDLTLFGASPESAVKYNHQTREIELYPIAGTKERGRIDGEINLDLDRTMEKELLSDPKEISEHMMLVDLAKEDLAQISSPHSIEIKELMKIDRYEYVMHIVSRVTGKLREDLDALDAYIACMNMGTLTGAPKLEAMERIYQFEKEARGAYGGAIGYWDGLQNFDSAIIIRSAVVKDDVATIRAGAGIVRESNPQNELEETRNKAKSVVRSLIS